MAFGLPKMNTPDPTMTLEKAIDLLSPMEPEMRVFPEDVEAIQTILQHLETLKRDKREILEALRNLHDWQNGCPLPSYEKQWGAAMEEAQRLFQLHEPIEGGKEE